MSSASSTERRAAGRDSGFQPWHFYMLVSLAGATWAVIVARDTHPAALILLSGAIVAAGFVGAALHAALAAFLSRSDGPSPVSTRTREFLEQEKALVLRSIKELEFDRAMGKVSDQDFAVISGRLRGRAIEILEALEPEPTPDAHRPADARTGDQRPTTERGEPADRDRPLASSADGDAAAARGAEAVRACPSCSTIVEPDARYCRRCGAKL